MSLLFHFEEKIHHKDLTRAEAIPLLFPRLLSQVLEHLGFPVEPHLKCRRVCEAIFTMEKWKFVPGDPLLPLRDPIKDHPCKTRENSNFLKNGKIVISIKTQKFSRSRMMKRILLLESSREI